MVRTCGLSVLFIVVSGFSSAGFSAEPTRDLVVDGATVVLSGTHTFRHVQVINGGTLKVGLRSLSIHGSV